MTDSDVAFKGNLLTEIKPSSRDEGLDITKRRGGLADR